jgi:hypothetical protein
MTRFASPPFAVLDACVLFSSFRRELFMHVATRQVYHPLWSEAILDEMSRNVVARSQEAHALDSSVLPRTHADMAHVTATLNRYLPEALQPAAAPRALTSCGAVDPKDRHVAAIALEARQRAGFAVTREARARRRETGTTPVASPRFGVVTENVKHFPVAALAKHRLFVMSSDAFARALFAWSGRELLGAIIAHMVGLAKPPLSAATYLEKLHANRMGTTAEAIQEVLLAVEPEARAAHRAVLGAVRGVPDASVRALACQHAYETAVGVAERLKLP